ncbi:MAG: xylulokinase [Rothia sp. (in: high G+C Gram-positive bacteria)]|nr:xylulokinase [Rothia sp. (in: high G+C Gram-positive bacteria)]
MADYVLGIDSSTQSVKALLVDAKSGQVVDQRRAAHPSGTEVNPEAWVQALHQVSADLLPRAAAVSIAGQQHGMILLDQKKQVLRDALLWNDTRSAPQAQKLTAYLGGPRAAAQRIGSVPLASYTATKLRWVQENEPHIAQKVAAVALPHDYLTMLLNTQAGLFTDHGEASGTAYYNPSSRSWEPDIAAWAIGQPVELPQLAQPAQVVGKTAQGALLAAGTGDNMAAALGLQLEQEDAVISIGTSAVVMMRSQHPVADAQHNISGFADATGHYLPLACTLNGAPVMDFACQSLGVNHDQLTELVLASSPGAGGAVFLPYLNGERTPNLPKAKAHLGLVSAQTSRADLARAMLEGLACSVREGLEKLLAAQGACQPRRIILIGGGAKSLALRQVLAQVLGIDIFVPQPAEFVALGAARQAAWALSGDRQPPQWPQAPMRQIAAVEQAHIYRQYLTYRNQLYPQVGEA